MKQFEGSDLENLGGIFDVVCGRILLNLNDTRPLPLVVIKLPSVGLFYRQSDGTVLQCNT